MMRWVIRITAVKSTTFGKLFLQKLIKRYNSINFIGHIRTHNNRIAVTMSLYSNLGQVEVVSLKGKEICTGRLRHKGGQFR